jgi:ATP-binding protein involved in chromosome partitioning
MEIRERADSGLPVLVVDPDGVHSRLYRDIAAKVWQQLASGSVAKPPPRIVFE